MNLAFTTPMVLAALALLPALLWILRHAPPPPQRLDFPPARLLLGLETSGPSTGRLPLWLFALRGGAMLLFILALAGPHQTAPAGRQANAVRGPLLLILDDGWTNAPHWAEARAAALAAARQAAELGAPVALALTASGARQTPTLAPASEAIARLQALEPSPWRTQRPQTVATLRALGGVTNIVWVSDGLADQGDDGFIRALAARGALNILRPPRTASVIASADAGERGLHVRILRADVAEEDTLAPLIAAESGAGVILASAPIRFGPAAQAASVEISLPPQLQARVARLRLLQEESAGAVHFLNRGAGRPVVGLPTAPETAEPLLSETFYLERALSPSVELVRGEIPDLLNRNLTALLLPDTGAIAPALAARLERFVERGGVLIRFAGPRLANDAAGPMPVTLRAGARSFGGAVAWEAPQRLAPFSAETPFFGLPAPSDLGVRRQVVADPVSLDTALVWATLQDGAPLVTAANRGRGRIVLFHVTATPAWSDLPLTGLFPAMLRRAIATGAQAGAHSSAPAQSPRGAYVLTDAITATGQLRPQPSTTRVDASALATPPSPAAPPGFYERGGDVIIRNAGDGVTRWTSLAPPAPWRAATWGAMQQHDLAPAFFVAAALLLIGDLFLAAALARRPRLAAPRAAITGALTALLAAMFFLPQPAQAQSRETDPTLVFRLAYIRSGDAGLDAQTRQGLEALSATLNARTAIDSAAPLAVDPARDDLSPLPLIYWAAPATPQSLSPAAQSNLERFMAGGGMLFIDTRGQATAAQILLRGVNAPPLQRIGADHVLSRSFYILRTFAGLAPSPMLWVETEASTAARDGAPSLIIGSGNWAAAWAPGASLPGGARQRELALRFGVNLVMVALTGNYKTDQIHTPALLERMGPRRAP